MKHTISALVKNTPGVLADMALEFKRLKLNISSISCGESENPDVARMVICVQGNESAIEMITQAMQEMDMVIRIDDLTRKEFVDRELVLIKVALTKDTTPQIMQIIEVFRAVVAGMGQETITVEMSGDDDRVNGLINMLRPFGIKSLCRTGRIAMKRGDE